MLLTPDFIRELEVLRRRLDTRARTGQRGEKVSPRRGASVEFLEHRAYAPMDDLRRIDWAAYARTGEPVLKVFRAEEDVVVRILCDTSASMLSGRSPKLPVAQRLTAAIGYMALARSERAQLHLVQEGLLPSAAPSRGRAGLGGFLRSIENAEAAGKTDLARAITDAVKRAARPGLLVVVSDFFDAGPLFGAASRAIMAGHELVLLQLVSPEDVEPELSGDLALVDCETGAVVEVTIDR
ncbi:MAG: DUF58 domain-containing protein, partial [Myxococcales bacterium]|nr:DUF58 domain-containing protein [Myxococcales bacterium]